MRTTLGPMRAGFSLLETLIVVAVVATLAALLIGTVIVFGRDAQRKKTGAILAALRTGIELTIAAKGGAISPAEHPFAGSRQPVASDGFRFLGLRGRAAPDGAAGAARWIAIAPGASAPRAFTLKGAEEWWIATAKDHAFMDDDVFADPRAPGLVGMPRAVMGVIGAQQAAVTEYWRVTRPSDGTPLTDPYAIGGDAAHVRFDAARGEGLPAENARALDYLFGSSAVESELRSLGALFATPTDPSYPAPDDDRALLLGDLAWSPDQTHRGWRGTGELAPRVTERWEPGRVAERADLGPWLRYRLRGLAVYDAWGREVFCGYGAGGGLRLLSLGGDGCYRYALGDDRRLDTDLERAADPADAPPAAGDGDGARDNVATALDE